MYYRSIKNAAGWEWQIFRVDHENNLTIIHTSIYELDSEDESLIDCRLWMGEEKINAKHYSPF